MRVALLAALVLGCNLMGELKGALALRRALAAEYHTDAINVNISNNSSLTVAFVNSPLAGLPGVERERAAKGIATFALQHYDRADSLTTIAVAFTSQRSAGAMTFTETTRPYTYTPAELRAGLIAGQKAAAETATTRR